MLLFPVTVVKYIIWWVSWIWRFNVKKEPYGKEEQIYLICKNMKISLSAWDSLEDDQQEKYLKRQLWIKVIVFVLAFFVFVLAFRLKKGLSVRPYLFFPDWRRAK